MREKLKKLPVPISILLAFGIMAGFLLLLNLSGILLGLIVGMDDLAGGYLSQLIAEIVCAAYGLGIVFFIGQKEILQLKNHNWLKSTYIAGFFVGYIVFDFIAQFYVHMMQTEHVWQSFFGMVIFTVTMLFVGFTEEIVCRGAVLNLLLDRFPKTKGGMIAAIILDGVLFGLMHLVNLLSGANAVSVVVQAITASFMGISFAALYVRTRNFWICAIAHALIDFASLFWGTLGQGNDLVSGINKISWMSLLAVLVFLAPILILLRKSKLQESVAAFNGQEIDGMTADAKPVAIVSLIMGILAIVMGCSGYMMGLGVVGLLGAILSLKWKKEHNGIAKAALIVSIVGIAANLLGVVFMAAVEIPLTSGMDTEQLLEQLQNLEK